MSGTSCKVKKKTNVLVLSLKCCFTLFLIILNQIFLVLDNLLTLIFNFIILWIPLHFVKCNDNKGCFFILGNVVVIKSSEQQRFVNEIIRWLINNWLTIILMNDQLFLGQNAKHPLFFSFQMFFKISAAFLWVIWL